MTKRAITLKRRLQCRRTKKNAARRLAGRTAAQRGYDRRWRKAQAAWLAEHPTCANCGTLGHGRPRDMHVDHIRPHRGNPALFWDPRNWQTLCDECHGKKSQREKHRLDEQPARVPPPTANGR